MSFTDGILIGSSHSYRTYGLQIKSRKIGLPEKKSIRQTVPFMTGYYDFTRLNGDMAWSERIIEYTFDLLEDTPQRLETKIMDFLGWIVVVHEESIHDDVTPDYHWYGSYESSEVNYDESGLQAEIKISFVVYPFRIKNSWTRFVMSEAAGNRLVRTSGMPTHLYIYGYGVSGTLTIGDKTITYSGNERYKETDIIISRMAEFASVIGGNIDMLFYEEMI